MYTTQHDGCPPNTKQHAINNWYTGVITTTATYMPGFVNLAATSDICVEVFQDKLFHERKADGKRRDAKRSNQEAKALLQGIRGVVREAVAKHENANLLYRPIVHALRRYRSCMAPGRCFAKAAPLGHRLQRPTPLPQAGA